MANFALAVTAVVVVVVVVVVLTSALEDSERRAAAEEMGWRVAPVPVEAFGVDVGILGNDEAGAEDEVFLVADGEAASSEDSVMSSLNSGSFDVAVDTGVDEACDGVNAELRDDGEIKNGRVPCVAGLLASFTDSDSETAGSDWEDEETLFNGTGVDVIVTPGVDAVPVKAREREAVALLNCMEDAAVDGTRPDPVLKLASVGVATDDSLPKSPLSARSSPCRFSIGASSTGNANVGTEAAVKRRKRDVVFILPR